MKILFHKNDLPNETAIVGKSIAIDTETMGLELSRDRLCLLQLKDESNTIHLIQFERGKYDCPNLKKILKDKTINKIFHYARFDVLAIYTYLGVLCDNIFCTKIASKLSRTYSNKHGLKELCKELLNVDLQKEQQSSNWGAAEINTKQQAYAADDVLYLHELKDKLTAMLKQENRLNIASSCFNFLPTRAVLDALRFDSEDYDIFKH
ncbi:MAG: ribonuclease D [Alphaproteobacteria bacterium]|nr:ribonuclease D [Alphaproteobacteria bacterium]